MDIVEGEKMEAHNVIDIKYMEAKKIFTDIFKEYLEADSTQDFIKAVLAWKSTKTYKKEISKSYKVGDPIKIVYKHEDECVSPNDYAIYKEFMEASHMHFRTDAYQRYCTKKEFLKYHLLSKQLWNFSFPDYWKGEELKNFL